MKRFPIFAILLVVFAAGCGSKSPTSASANPNQVKFLAALLPANEVPAVTGVEAGGSGTAVITLNVTRDAANAITGATADFTVTLAGFPANTPVNAAHIHPGAAGSTGGALVSLGLVTGGITLDANGTGTFTRTGITSNLSATTVQDLINNPANWYFNVHSSLNPGGFARGQLVKQ